jgi:hypothetical protein
MVYYNGLKVSYWDMLHMNKKLTAAVIIYIVAITTMAAIGLIGDTGAESGKFAEKHFSIDEINASRSYFSGGIIPATIFRIVTAILLMLMIRKNYFPLKSWIERRSSPDFLKILAGLFIVLAVIELLQFPFAISTDYLRNSEFGLMRSDFRTWLLRYISFTGISITLTSLIAAAIAMIIMKTRLYPIYLPAAFFVIMLFATFLYPRTVMPLFYETASLE